MAYMSDIIWNMTRDEARTYHHEAEKAREDQDFLAALAAIDKAMLGYAKTGNVYGLAEAHASRVITLRHMADKTGRKEFLVSALHTAQAGVTIAEDGNVSVAILYQNLGKVQKALGDIDGAIESFKKAVDGQQNNPHETQDRPGVLANMKELLATTELSQGNQSARERAVTALADLEVSDEEPYAKNVWLSHGYGRLAYALKDTDKAAAKEYFAKARAIIDANPDMKLSQGIFEKLEGALK